MHVLTAPRPPRRAALAGAGALLLLALGVAPVTLRESPERGHGLGARVVGGSQGARLPVPTPQEIDALRQLLRILASLAGSGSSQVADESASFLVPQQQQQQPARHSMPPAHAHAAPTRRRAGGALSTPHTPATAEFAT